MQAPPPPTRKRNALIRYAPFLAVVVIIAIVVAIAGGKDSKKPKVKTENTAGTARVVPITYNEAKAAGTVDKYTWQKTCDTTTGLIAIPVQHAAPCVPAFTGKNSGASAPGVSSDSINIVFYVA